MKLIVALLFATLTATALAASPVDGNWNGSIETQNGPVQIAFTFLADGAALTGSTTGPDGSQVTIKNGRIEGNKISFAVDIDFAGTPVTIGYVGTVMAEQIDMTLDFMGMPLDLQVKKAK